MGINNLGYLSFFGEKCVYIQEDMSYILVPVNEEANILGHSHKENYSLSFSDKIYKRCIASVKRQAGSGIGYVRLDLNYVYKGVSDKSIDGFIMTGNEIDEFFSPLEYYFHKKRHEEYKPTDLLYGQDVICKYYFNYHEKPIEVELVYGNVLVKGNRTDLTIHPQLIVKFDSTNDTDFVYHVSSVIIKFLQLVHRKTTYNINKLDLFHDSEGKKTNVGYLFGDLYDRNIRASSRIEASFIYYGEKASNILSIIATEEEFPLSHLSSFPRNAYEYTPDRLGAISAAFEYEYDKNIQYPQKIEFNMSGIKKDLNEYIDKIQGEEKEVRYFKKQAQNAIGKIGTQLGLKQKIINASSYNSKALSSSLPFLLGRNETVDRVASIFPRLRGKVLHKEAGYSFSDDEIECIRFIEVLQYVMLLKRAGYGDEEIEIILGAIYYCNNAYINQLLSDKQIGLLDNKRG